MSQHNDRNPQIDAELIKHGLPHDKPSQLADAFRNGYRAAEAELQQRVAEAETDRRLLSEAFNRSEARIDELEQAASVAVPETCRAKQVGPDQWVCDCETPLACDKSGASTQPAVAEPVTSGMPTRLRPTWRGMEREPEAETSATASVAGIHYCSYFCDRPECVKTQRDELRQLFELQNKPAPLSVPSDDVLVAIGRKVDVEFGYAPQDEFNDREVAAVRRFAELLLAEVTKGGDA